MTPGSKECEVRTYLRQTVGARDLSDDLRRAKTSPATNNPLDANQDIEMKPLISIYAFEFVR
jgi:hypothetical protein